MFCTDVERIIQRDYSWLALNHLHGHVERVRCAHMLMTPVLPSPLQPYRTANARSHMMPAVVLRGNHCNTNRRHSPSSPFAWRVSGTDIGTWTPITAVLAQLTAIMPPVSNGAVGSSEKVRAPAPAPALSKNIPCFFTVSWEVRCLTVYRMCCLAVCPCGHTCSSDWLSVQQRFVSNIDIATMHGCRTYRARPTSWGRC